MIRNRLNKAAAPAFTLVELLVAMAVLVILVLLVSQLVNNASITTLNSRKHLDADSEARMVFDRMGYDFARMPKRTDLDYIFFSNQEGNDKMFFYSEAPGYDTSVAALESTTSLVGYRVNSSLQLERLGKALTWDGNASGVNPGGEVFLSYPAGSNTPDPSTTLDGVWPAIIGGAPNYNGVDPNGYHVIADGVFRMEFCFQQKDGAYVLPTQSHPTPAFNIPSNVSAIVVALGILDPTSRVIVSNSNGLVSALKAPQTGGGAQNNPALPDTLPLSQLMAETWTAAINTPTFAQTTGIPKAAASQIRIYQRTFYLHTK